MNKSPCRNWPRSRPAWPSLAAVVFMSLSLGCAGVKNPSGSTGSGGSGGTLVPPCIAGLQSISVGPATQTVNLSLDQNTGTFSSVSASFRATGTMSDGSTQDVSDRVLWPSSFATLVVRNGDITVSAPGTYTISAKCGNLVGSGKLLATFHGDVNEGSVGAQKGVLDGAPNGSAQIAYPLDGALFPSNLTPIYVHVQANGVGAAARLEFSSADDVVNIHWYGPCESDPVNLPGPGCYVQLPLAFTKLLIPSSEAGDLNLVARVAGGTGVSESGPIHVAWSNVKLSGGLYYWTVIDPLSVPNYTSPEIPAQPLGTGVQRYDFDNTTGAPAPELVWTDRGAPPLFPGSAQAFGPLPNQVAGGHCVGCHAITPNDGKYMALTLGGSSSVNGANFSLLDIAAKSLISINAAYPMDQNSSPISNPTDYFKQFRRDSLATETTWGPNGDVMVNMYQSRLYLTTVTLTGTTGVVSRVGPATPSWGEYQSDPFWSVNGDLLAFTSFPAPDVDPNNPTGLNGDMKAGGQIAIASTTPTAVHDDAHVIVPRENGISSFYPAISSDSQLIVFNRSTCGGTPDANKLTSDYGNQSCDGYDDWTSTLWLTTPSGASVTRLDRANGSTPASNSWPRWSPDVGTFRGKSLYWIAYSSRRPYGTQVNYNAVPTLAKPQLWFSGVLVGGEFQGDPSFAPVWLPSQNPRQSSPNGNHVPQWVKVAIIIPP